VPAGSRRYLQDPAIPCPASATTEVASATTEVASATTEVASATDEVASAANQGGTETYGAHNALAACGQGAAAAGIVAMMEVAFDRGAPRGFIEWNSENYLDACWRIGRA